LLVAIGAIGVGGSLSVTSSGEVLELHPVDTTVATKSP